MGVDWQSKGRGSRSDAIRFPWRRHLPSPHPPTVSRGVTHNFSPCFPSTGFVWQIAIRIGSVLGYLGQAGDSRVLPLPRVSSLKGL
jgi:hypothetical protein